MRIVSNCIDLKIGYRHSLARAMESETLPENEPVLGRLRRCSSVDQANVELLLDQNVTPSSAKEEENQQGNLVSTSRPKLKRMSSMEEVESASCKLEPRIEGRIVVIGPETLPRLIKELQEWEHHAINTIRESMESVEN